MADDKTKKVEVKLPENVMVDYTFERMVKSFIKQVQKDGIIELVKKRRYYEKPSALKRLAEKERRRKS